MTLNWILRPNDLVKFRHEIREDTGRLRAAFLVALLAIACGRVPLVFLTDDDRTSRFEHLKRGLALRWDNPGAAAQAFGEAGVGPELERLRFELWLGALERGDSSPPMWRDFLDQRPPEDLGDRGRLALARSLMDEGQMDVAWEIIAEISENARVQADVLRLEWPNDTRQAAATRLAVEAPVVLWREASFLEKAAIAGLGPEDRIARAIAWRESGHPSRGVSELRTLRARGDLERQRRLELARCELNRGSTSAALQILPRLARCDGDEAELRAQSWRRRGWSRYPGRTAVSAFKECLSAAQRAVSLQGGSPHQALEIQLECGTEAGRFEPALAAWRSLAEVNWRGSRRSWLGRRLGIALAESGRGGQAVEDLASSLEGHRRSLVFAEAAKGLSGQRGVLSELAKSPIPDLYALWSMDATGQIGPPSLELPSTIDTVEPPRAVAWLIDVGEPGLASQEWRRLVKKRGAEPGEALAAAVFEDGRGRPDLAIGVLRRGFDDLGSPAMAGVPENVVRAYLPLRWTNELAAAAREFGLDPWLLAGLARQESIFNARARSPAGARGVVQLMPGTAGGHARALGLGRNPDLFDPGINLRLGARELAHLIEAFGHLEPALAAYNAGQSRVRRWWRQWPETHRFTEAIPIPETYTYVRRVTFLSEAYRLVWAEAWEGEAGN